MKLDNWILFASTLVVLFAAVYAVFVHKQVTKELRFFLGFVFLSGIIQLVSLIIWFNSINNMPLLHIYVAVGFIFLALFYADILHGFIKRKVILYIIITFSLFTIVNSLFIQNIRTYNSYALTVECILIIILSISTYLFSLEDLVKEKRQELWKSISWINSGLFIYYTSSLIIFNFAHFFFSDPNFKIFSRDFNLQTWMLHSFFSTVMYCCFIIGLWNRPKA